jgi:hypothetical protein
MKDIEGRRWRPQGAVAEEGKISLHSWIVKSNKERIFIILNSFFENQDMPFQ